MSPSNRGSVWANSGMVVEIRPEDIDQYSRYGVLSGIKFQEELEYQCYVNGNCKQTAPAQRMTEISSIKKYRSICLNRHTPRESSPLPLHFWMPNSLLRALERGFSYFGKISKGFLTREALMIGVETRTSSR